MKIDVSKLPRDHPARSLPLEGAKYGKGNNLKQVMPSFKIASLCYNDLGKAWIEDTEWWVEVPPEIENG